MSESKEASSNTSDKFPMVFKRGRQKDRKPVTITLRKLDDDHPAKRRREDKKHYQLEYRYDGKRSRTLFGKRAEAVEAYESKKDHYENSSESHRAVIGNDKFRDRSAECLKLLQDHNENWSKDELNKQQEEAVKFYLAHLSAEDKKNTAPISQVSNELMYKLETTPKKKTGGMRSKNYLDGVRNQLDKFEKYFENCALSSLTDKQIESWLNGLTYRGKAVSTTSKDNYRTTLCTLFNFAVERNYIEQKDNPMRIVGEYVRDVAKGYLQPNEVISFLQHCDESLRAIYAICFFTGIRPCYRDGELARLRWEDFNHEESTLTIKGALLTREGKSLRTREIPIQPNLQKWLKPYEHKKGLVIESYSVHRRKFEKAVKESGIEWKRDATRNGFATYRFKILGNKFSVMSETGHSEESTFEEHYRSPESKKTAEAYFNITPDSLEKTAVFEPQKNVA